MQLKDCISFFSVIIKLKFRDSTLILRVVGGDGGGQGKGRQTQLGQHLCPWCTSQPLLLSSIYLRG